MSAAICTRDRPEQLSRALRSLSRQNRMPSEVLVIDNAPSDDSSRRTVQDRFPGVLYVRESSAGLDVARNRALKEASQPIVAFLDDDAVADAGWCGALARVLEQDSAVALCTGRVEALSLETEAQRLFEANGGFARGRQRLTLPDAARSRRLHGRRAPLIAWAVSVGSGCSFAVRRETALAVGGFDEALDRGEALPGGGDHDMIWRLLQTGARIVYEPAALARHEHRRETATVAAQIAGHQRGLMAFLVKSLGRATGADRLWIAAFLGWRLIKPGARIVQRLAGRDPLPLSLLARMWWNCFVGLFSYRAAEGRPEPQQARAGQRLETGAPR